MSESPEAMTNSSCGASARNASTASKASLMSAPFFVCVKRGQSTTSKPASVKGRRNFEKYSREPFPSGWGTDPDGFM